MKRLLLIALLAAGAYFALGPAIRPPEGDIAGNSRNETAVASEGSDAILEQAFASRRSNLQVSGQGTVTRILPDDNDGSRHQRFIVRLDSGLSLLMSHNIDLAPRIESLRVGDIVDFYGEYEWNAKGGVIHWTHHDPQGRHAAGWIKHAGRTYQ